ncbi:hypothetical protein ABF176_002516, partial [Flavobacterium psychrophilum]
MGIISSNKNYLLVKLTEENKTSVLKYSKIFQIISLILIVIELLFILYSYFIYSILKNEESYGDGGVLNSTKYDNDFYTFIFSSLLIVIIVIISINLIFS